MTDFARRFSSALGVFAFGVAGFVSMINGVEVFTTLWRAFAAGFVFFMFGKLLAVALFYDTSNLPGSPASGHAASGLEKKETKKEE